MTPYDFDEKLAEGEHWESQLDEVFARDFEIEKVDRDEQTNGIDRWFTSRICGYRFSVQYKSDNRGGGDDGTRNAFLELLWNVDKNLRGLVFTCQARMLVYYVIGNDEAYCWPPKLMEFYVLTWLSEYEYRDIPNKGWKTRGLLVPLDVIRLVPGVVHKVNFLGARIGLAN